MSKEDDDFEESKSFYNEALFKELDSKIEKLKKQAEELAEDEEYKKRLELDKIMNQRYYLTDKELDSDFSPWMKIFRAYGKNIKIHGEVI